MVPGIREYSAYKVNLRCIYEYKMNVSAFREFRKTLSSASWFQSNKALWSGLSTYPASRLSHPARKVLLQELGSKAHDPVHGVQVQCREPAGHLTGHGYLGLLGALCAAGVS